MVLLIFSIIIVMALIFISTTFRWDGACTSRTKSSKASSRSLTVLSSGMDPLEEAALPGASCRRPGRGPPADADDDVEALGGPLGELRRVARVHPNGVVGVWCASP